MSDAGGEGSAQTHTVRVGERAIVTPKGTTIAVPTAALAAAIAAEWPERPKAKLDPRTMKLTRIAASALDLVRPQRARVITELVAYAETELVCHRADSPARLVARQEAAWQPLLDWLHARFDAPLSITHSVVAHKQPPASLATLGRALERLDDFRLAALSLAATASGSLVIGLALIDGHLDAQAAFDAAELDATYQIEEWGEDHEATARRAEVREDLETAARFIALLTDGPGN
jgi:chaperone required for assembly of F1-ATPase